MLDIHNVDSSLKRLIHNIDKDSTIHKPNKDAISDYIEFMKAKGLKKTSIRKDVYSLRFIARALKDKEFEKATKKDYVKVLSIVNEQKWAEQTKRNHRVALKKFGKWIKGIDKKGHYPEEVDWIETSHKKEREILPEDLITKKEFDRMISVCDNPRDKAMLFLMFETGARIGEVLNLQIKNIVEKDDVMLVMLSGKTGMRRIPIIASIQAIRIWLNIHPQRDDSNAYVWVTKFNSYSGSEYSPINYNGVRKILRKIKKRARIKKRIYPHLFRHTSGTQKAIWLSPQLSMKYHGWKTPDMVQRYSHLSTKDLSDVVKKHYGTDEKKERNNQLEILMIDFMKEMVKSNPKLKQKFADMVKERGMEEQFK